MYDSIIIGAGMSGLAAGIRSAYYDQKVCILERHNTIGGLNSFYRLRGRNYDVGLHAVTNFTPRGTRRGPFARLLRQLRLTWDDFGLSPQLMSSISFPNVELAFDNNIDLLRSEVARAFPNQIDNFEKLMDSLIDYDDLEQSHFELSTREQLSEVITDPLLIEMILCPVMWYGNPREHDMDYGQFCIMFRALFLEGLARPFDGVRLILRKLVRKFRELGGELKLRTGVQQIKIDGGRAVGVVLDCGDEMSAKNILSSVGAVETFRLCDDDDTTHVHKTGQLSFIEAISTLDTYPLELGHDKTIIFFNDSDKFHWQRPLDDLCDVRTGVICTPNNYCYDAADGELPDGIMRITALADFNRWKNLNKDNYDRQKEIWFNKVVDSATKFAPDFREHTIDTDMFTPQTIQRFTSHDNGAVYGATRKWFDGTTNFKNLFLCGTDQGFVGIVGSIISGISMANHHLLRGN
ncbi:MAG TPA: NAD(P)/FAD-dependent oxidoreductase [Planctomycetes bacterium]|nr:NAD(P)/FAD-dependent oxidoreductase [Planctomycetota bacterium]